MTRIKIQILPLLLLLNACASTPPAAEVCSAQWIKPRTDAALARFKGATEDTWSTLQRRGKSAAEPDSMGLLEKARIILSLTKLVAEFEDSRTLADLRTLGRTCNDPDLVRNALRGMLHEYNVPEPYIELLDQLEDFIEVLDGAGKTAASSR